MFLNKCIRKDKGGLTISISVPEEEQRPKCLMILLDILVGPLLNLQGFSGQQVFLKKKKDPDVQANLMYTHGFEKRLKRLMKRN